MVAIYSDKKEFVFRAVCEMYSDVALHPGKTFHFPTGRLACLFVGYPAAQLDVLPATAVESFAGVGYPFAAGAIQHGDVVLDIGSGSGTDTLLASTLANCGTVYGLDMTAPMLDKLARNVAAMGATHVRPLQGNAEEIPLPDASVDVVTSNGVLNLVPDKPRAFAEIARVLKPGGRVGVTDIVADDLLSAEQRAERGSYVGCIAGALSFREFRTGLQAVGLTDVELVPTHQIVEGMHAAIVRATKPA